MDLRCRYRRQKSDADLLPAGRRVGLPHTMTHANNPEKHTGTGDELPMINRQPALLSVTVQRIAERGRGVQPCVLPRPGLSNGDGEVGERCRRGHLSSGSHAQKPRSESDSSTTSRLCTDGGVSPQDLTLFDLETLYTLAANGPTYGLGIKTHLDDLYGDIGHARVYQALDRLEGHGLVTHQALDDRTNEYRLTPAGADLVAQDARRRHRITTDHTPAIDKDATELEEVADGDD